MRIEAVIGPVGPMADGTFVTPRLGKFLEQMVSELNPRYYEQAYRGRVFSASSAAGTSSAGLATTYTGGVCVSNPVGSLVNLVPIKISAALVVVSAALTAAGVITGYAAGGVTVHTTALVPVSGAIGAAIVPVAKVDQACTLVGTPGWEEFFATTGITVGAYAAVFDPEGSIIVPPGGYVATGTTIASPAAGAMSTISWMEVPV